MLHRIIRREKMIRFFVGCLFLCSFILFGDGDRLSLATVAPAQDTDLSLAQGSLNESLAELGKDMMQVQMDNEELRKCNQRLLRRLSRYRETITENKELRIKIARMNKELSRLQDRNPFYRKNAQLKKIEILQKLNSELERKVKDLYVSIKKLEGFQRDKDSMERAFQEMVAERLSLKNKNEKLSDALNASLRVNNKRQAALYAELGSAYIKLKLFELAILAYEEALKMEPKNPESYYSLGVLYNYDHPGRDRRKAVQYLKEYLLLKPHTKNKKEVQYLIDMIAKDI